MKTNLVIIYCALSMLLGAIISLSLSVTFDNIQQAKQLKSQYLQQAGQHNHRQEVVK